MEAFTLGIILGATIYALFSALGCAWLADEKGRNPLAWAILGLFFSFAAMILLAGSPTIEAPTD